MKTREGFVSNSSSTSFVIAISDSTTCRHCGRTDHDFLDLVEHAGGWGDDENCVRAIGINETLRVLKQDFWLDENELAEIEGKIKLAKSTNIALVEISYHNKVLNEILKKSKNIEIIDELN